MDHKEHPEWEAELDLELDLEDIVREFSDAPPLEEIVREFAPERPKPVPTVSTDTVRLDSVRTSVRQGNSADHTRRFAAVDMPAEEPVPKKSPAPKPAAAEPFSEGWEPEYEQPMGHYVPKEPIPFENRNQLRHLREQLVQRAERRYYALAEAGTTSLRLSGFLIFLVFLLSAGASFALEQGYISGERIKLVAFCQFLAVLISALLCHGRLLEGAVSLLRRRFTLNTFLAITFVICLADSVVCLGRGQISCSSIFCLQGAVAQWAACHARQREMLQMDTLRKASQLTAVVKRGDYYQGLSGYVTAEGQLESFMDHYCKPSAPERMLHIFAAMGLGFGILVAAVVGLHSGWVEALQVLTAMVLLALPATCFISMRRPECLVERRLHHMGTVLCGWQGVKAVEKQDAVPVSHSDLFPKDSIGMNGMKFYGDLDPDMVICYTGSLISYEGGSLTGIFDPLMASRYIRHAAVEEFGSYPGGLSALVDGEPIAVGTLEFMRQMDVQVPQAAQISHAIYTAVDGVLCGVFALRYSRSKTAAAGLRNLCGNSKVTPVMISRDFLLTGRFLREKLKVNTKRLVFPDGETRKALEEKTGEADAPVVALMVRKGLPQRAYAVTGSLALRSAMQTGAWIHIIGGGLGMAAVAVLALIGATHLLTPVNLLAYNLLWMIPGWLITQWSRYI